MTREVRLGYLVTHPIQYQVPLLRKLAETSGIKLTVLFVSSISTSNFFDPGFGRTISWDADLTEGYRHSFVSRGPASALLSFWRPTGELIGAALDQEKLDCLWVHGYAQVGLIRGIFHAARRRIPLMFRGEGHRLCQADSALRVAKDAVLRRAAGCISAFLCVGKLNREYYEELGVPARRIFSVPYAVDNEFFRQEAARYTADRDSLLRDLSLPFDQPVILFASKLTPRKRPSDLLAAYLQLLRSRGASDPLPSLIFVGDGAEMEQLKRSASAATDAPIRFVGFQAQRDLPKWYSLCDLFVLPSEKEPWGLVVNEVMNAGKAVICSSEVGAAYDLVEHGRNGFVYPVRETGALAATLRSATASRERLAVMGAVSRKLIGKWTYDQDVAGIVNAAAYCISGEIRHE